MAVHLPAGPELVIVLDCRDLDLVADFWAAVLGYERTSVDEPYCSVVPPSNAGSGIELLLQRVGEPKQGKNRLHLDLRVADLDAEVRRVGALGARLVTQDPIVEDGWRWYVLADPEGNEFCVLRAPGDRSAAQAGSPAEVKAADPTGSTATAGNTAGSTVGTPAEPAAGRPLEAPGPQAAST